MIFFKFNDVNACALLILIHLVSSSASKIWHPIGLSSMTRIGRSEDSGPDPSFIRLTSKKWHPLGLGSIARIGKRNEDFDSEPSFTHSDDKRVKMTNFIRTGRSTNSYKFDGNQEREPCRTEFGIIDPLVGSQLGKDLYTILNQEYPANGQLGYNDQKDTFGRDLLGYDI